MNGFYPFIIVTVAYFLAGSIVSLVHPKLLRPRFSDLRTLELGLAGWLLKPLMAISVFLLFCAVWPIAWFNAGKSEKRQAAYQAAQLDRLRSFGKVRTAMTAPVKYAGGEGSSFDDAVVIIGGTILSGPHAEYAYLERLFPGYQLLEQCVREYNGRKFDVLQFTTIGGENKVIYFDISGHLPKPK